MNGIEVEDGNEDLPLEAVIGGYFLSLELRILDIWDLLRFYRVILPWSWRGYGFIC